MRRHWIPLTVFGVVLASRLPFITHELWAWDSVLYARALEQGFHVGFALEEQRPHPPGYLFYVAAAALARLVTLDSNLALVVVSVLASAAAAALMFVLARRFTGTGAALFVTAGFAANPLVWTYGEVAYPYAVLGLLSIGLALAFHGARGMAARTLAASLAFGALAGFRQDVLLLLGPLWLWVLWPLPWRTRGVAFAACGAGILTWLVPTALLSGGFSAYIAALSQQSGAVGLSYSVGSQGLAALSYNLRFTIYALAWGLLAFGVLLLGLLIGAAAGMVRSRRRPSPAATFFLAWISPALLFYVAVHIGEWGYVLSVLPAFYVLAGALLAAPLATVHGHPRGWRAGAAIVALLPALLFTLGSERFSAKALAHHDLAVETRMAHVRAHFPPDRTIVLAREDYLTVRYYLPEYRVWFHDPDPYRAGHTRKRAMRATTIVIFTEGLVARQNLDVRYVQIAEDVTIAYVSIEPGSVLEFSGERFVVRDGP